MKLSLSIILTGIFKNIFQSKKPNELHITLFVQVPKSVLIQLFSTEQQSWHSVSRQMTVPAYLPRAHTHGHGDAFRTRRISPHTLYPFRSMIWQTEIRSSYFTEILHWSSNAFILNRPWTYSEGAHTGMALSRYTRKQRRFCELPTGVGKDILC
jgi:hypothetical protein